MRRVALDGRLRLAVHDEKRALLHAAEADHAVEEGEGGFADKRGERFLVRRAALLLALDYGDGDVARPLLVRRGRPALRDRLDAGLCDAHSGELSAEVILKGRPQFQDVTRDDPADRGWDAPGAPPRRPPLAG